jgi:hypothetical protein
MSGVRKASGPVFGRYQPISLLGEGSVARVYLAVSRGPVGWGNLLVIKEIRQELANQSQFRDMFLHEARMALGLHHPNIVQTYEIFEHRAPYVVAMEFLDGQTLSCLLKRVGRTGVPLSLQLWVLTQVLAGLQHAHDLRDADGKPLRMVHRDVSPTNVFLTYDGQVKLMDFGIAKFAGMVAKQDGSAATGKLGYGAPEQFVSQPIDPRSDVYSVGVMLWEALAGKRRRISESRSAIVDARIGGQEPRISDVVADIPPVLAEICDKATALDRRDRYQSALEMQQALESYLDGCWEPVDRRELAEILDRAFSLERASMRRCIERQLNASGVALRPLGLLPRRPRLATLRGGARKAWARIRLAGLSTLPVLRAYGPGALVVLATGFLVATVWAMTSHSTETLRAAQRSARPQTTLATGAVSDKKKPDEPSRAAPVAKAENKIESKAEAERVVRSEPERPPTAVIERLDEPDDESNTEDPPPIAGAEPATERPDSPSTFRRARATLRVRKLSAFDRFSRPQVQWTDLQPGEELPPPDRLPRRALDEEDPYGGPPQGRAP